MKNNKGFTLMEVIAAIFIGGMVTAAIVLVWKTASTQTSQSQRQTIIRNQISAFQRQLYKDFYSADMITWPNHSNNGNDVILAGLKKAKRTDQDKFEVFRYAPQGPTTYFAYCMDEIDGAGVIKRLEETIEYDPDNLYRRMEDYIGPSVKSSCIDKGVIVLSNFNLTNASLAAEDDSYYNGIYTLSGNVSRTFRDRMNTTPIYIEINETLLSNGGI